MFDGDMVGSSYGPLMMKCGMRQADVEFDFVGGAARAVVVTTGYGLSHYCFFHF